MTRKLFRAAAPVVTVALLLAACGDSDDDAADVVDVTDPPAALVDDATDDATNDATDDAMRRRDRRTGRHRPTVSRRRRRCRGRLRDGRAARGVVVTRVRRGLRDRGDPDQPLGDRRARDERVRGRPHPRCGQHADPHARRPRRRDPDGSAGRRVLRQWLSRRDGDDLAALARLRQRAGVRWQLQGVDRRRARGLDRSRRPAARHAKDIAPEMLAAASDFLAPCRRATSTSATSRRCRPPSTRGPTWSTSVRSASTPRVTSRVPSTCRSGP